MGAENTVEPQEATIRIDPPGAPERTTRIDGVFVPASADGAPAVDGALPGGAKQRVDAEPVLVPALADVERDGSEPVASSTQRVDGSFVPAATAPAARSAPQSVRPGAELVLRSGHYQVVRLLGRPSGEAEVFLVQKDGVPYAFKYYYAHVRPSDAVLSVLQTCRHDAVVALLEYSVYGGRTYELMEYAAGGSVADTTDDGRPRYVPLRDEARLKRFVAQVAAGLGYLHEKGLVHRDVKPANLFWHDAAATQIKIADFGLAALSQHTSGKHVTVQNRTAEYAAPEIYRTLAGGHERAGQIVVGKEVDFYALGITVLYLWLGRNPFEGVNEFVSMNLKADSNVALPEDMPISLRRLVRGLITVVPKHRWGLAEVQRWLEGKHVELYEDVGVAEKAYPALNLGDLDGTGRDTVVKSPPELADVLLKNPRRGLQYLYQGKVTSWLEPVDTPLHSDVHHLITEEYPLGGVVGSERDARASAALHKAVYLLDARRAFRTHGGTVCETLEQVGDAFEAEQAHYRIALQDPLDPFYLFLEARKQHEFAERLRRYARQVTRKRAHSEEQAFNEILLSLQHWKQLKVDGQCFQSPAEILAAPRSLRDTLARQLAGGGHTKVALWLAAVMQNDPGWPQRFARWRSLGRHDGATLAYVLDPQAPFDFMGTPVFTPHEFLEELQVHLDVRNPQPAFGDPDGDFVQDADFWLAHYAHRPPASESPLDALAFSGYAEVLQQCLATAAGTLPAGTAASLKTTAAVLVERRFDRPGMPGAWQAGIETLRSVSPDHVICGLHKAEEDKAHAVLRKENRNRSTRKQAVQAQQYAWGVAAALVALLLPMLIGSVAGSLAIPYVSATVWGVGALAMGYGFLRAALRAGADETDVMLEARFVTLIIGATLMGLFCAFTFVTNLTSGAGVGGSFVGFLLGLVACLAGAYVLGHVNARLAVQWHQTREKLRALPMPRERLGEPEVEQVLDQVAGLWKQHPRRRA